MTITITPTPEFYRINDGLTCRVWDGVTAAGVPCRVLVVALQVPEGVDFSEFDAGLKAVNVVYHEAPDPERN